MTISDNLNRIINAKAAIKQSIENKGVTVSDTALLDEYPALIDSIEAGGGDPYYENLFLVTTANNTKYSYLFYGSDAATIDLSRLDASKVTSMDYMFGNCFSLTELDLSHFDTSKVTDMDYMFSNCTKLATLDLSNWDTSNVTNMYSMFQSCSKLTKLDVSHFDTSNVTSMTNMFSSCINLTSIDVSNFNINTKANTISGIFYQCKALTELDCSNWDISHITGTYNITNAFDNCTSLVDFKAPKNISAPMSLSGSKALSHDSLMSVINNLTTVTSTKKLTLGSTNLAKLTAEEIAIATNKGWTVS